MRLTKSSDLQHLKCTCLQPPELCLAGVPDSPGQCHLRCGCIPDILRCKSRVIQVRLCALLGTCPVVWLCLQVAASMRKERRAHAVFLD